MFRTKRKWLRLQRWQCPWRKVAMVVAKLFLMYISYTVISYLLTSSSLSAAQSSPWTWRCLDGVPTTRCVKERKVEGSTDQISLETCKLTCGPFGSLFPYPKHVAMQKSTKTLSPNAIELGVVNCLPGVCDMIYEAFGIFILSVAQYHPKYTIGSDISKLFGAPNQNHQLTVDITIEGADNKLFLSTDESYTLTVSTEGATTKAVINAPNFFGGRHALETLSQLIDYDEEFNAIQIVSAATISDEPTYKYRGVIIDTSRNYMPVEQLRRIVDGLAYSKLNIFHWHITDTQAFPFHMRSLPNMTRYGAYSRREVYQPEDIKELVAYALVRGVKIIPELDAPAHAGHGWEWGPEAGLGNLVVCLDKQPWEKFCANPPCGQLNIANPNIYTVLSKIYKEMVAAFGELDIFHFGGDEVYVSCWNSTEEIVAWMTANGHSLSKESYFKQWTIFQEKAYQLFTDANNGVIVPGILTTSDLTEIENVDQFMNKDKYFVQIWTNETDPVIAKLLKKGYKVIMSNSDKLYLDCGFSSWLADGGNWCSPYKGWQDVYDNDITSITQKAAIGVNIKGQVLGGEAGLWSEQIDANTIDARMWPRTSALGERLWSDPKTNYRHAETRILEHRRRLALRGLKPSRLQPEWCRQNAGECASHDAE